MTVPSSDLEGSHVGLFGTPYFATIWEKELELSGSITPYFAAIWEKELELLGCTTPYLAAMLAMESEMVAVSAINGSQIFDGQPYKSTGSSRGLLLLERGFLTLELLFVVFVVSVPGLGVSSALDAALFALELDEVLASSALDAALLALELDDFPAFSAFDVILASSALDAALLAVSLDAALFALELDEPPSVFSEMVLDGVSGFTVTGPDAVSSQLAQKNPVRAMAIFFQCL